ncbi:unnamed protein product [Musa acuminata subsp. malaccensis]|uniref:(wild Malaysian banana) hypothetical protein n=1 Tax=Musa acuminata subsp. malaccensis TaxID=214687 RepID=A0A804I5X2_MUSAM|nr:unnamed protein product [Musa acuminata subsp. malaccensis]
MCMLDPDMQALRTTASSLAGDRDQKSVQRRAQRGRAVSQGIKCGKRGCGVAVSKEFARLFEWAMIPKPISQGTS